MFKIISKADLAATVIPLWREISAKQENALLNFFTLHKASLWWEKKKFLHG